MHGFCANTMPFYIRDLSKRGAWYLQGSWDQSPVDMDGWLYWLSSGISRTLPVPEFTELLSGEAQGRATLLAAPHPGSGRCLTWGGACHGARSLGLCPSSQEGHSSLFWAPTHCLEFCPVHPSWTHGDDFLPPPNIPRWRLCLSFKSCFSSPSFFRVPHVTEFGALFCSS